VTRACWCALRRPTRTAPQLTHLQRKWSKATQNVSLQLIRALLFALCYGKMMKIKRDLQQTCAHAQTFSLANLDFVMALGSSAWAS